MDSLIAWLTAVPIGTLYVALALVAAIENIFPPIPADTVVAFGSFLAARGRGSVVAAFAATWLGNVTSAMVMYGVGRRYGAARFDQRFLGARGPQAESRLERLYGRYGVAALFASRFIPGVRAIVPPFAGALRVPPVRAGIAIAAASAIWYGTVSYLGFTIGGNWPRVQRLITDYGRILAIMAAVVLLVGAVIWRTRSRKISEL
ncbi:MAG TPA: DedA family protein [Gemmatimonadaceae bacterium]